MANRIYFANQQLAFRRDTDNSAGAYTVAHGVQSVAVTTTFNLEQAFELGQLAIYENIEGVPDIELTATKVLDGYPLLYHLATQEAAGHDRGPTLAGRSNAKCAVAIGIWPDTEDSTGKDTSNPVQQMECSGMFASSVSYSFPLEDNFTEDITLVGNDKGWKKAGSTEGVNCETPPWQMVTSTGQFTTNADAPIGTGGVNRRENLAFNASSASDAGGIQYTYLPTQIPGVDSNGWMNPVQQTTNAHLQSISVSCDLGREELFELGTRQPYARIVTFPVEVTCDIEVLSISGDMIDAYSDGCGDNTLACTGIVDNLENESIRIVTCEGTSIFLGDKNKLASVNYGGGDAGGGNVTVSYSYSTFNDFTVLHPQDPDASGTKWWNTRGTYLT
tara:strand:- start:6758 stop:7924 length:1167 start_codon:yes stop_codon:yes gene_type:complete